jgi:hypothetical protein
VAPLSSGGCPASHPVKGNINGSERIYHVLGGASYATTKPEACFLNTEAAAGAGFRPAAK